MSTTVGGGATTSQLAGLTSFRSLWEDTAPSATAYPSLLVEREFEVVVVGGGYTGLSAALHLAERGVKVGVLEAQTVGWGASGRNGGQVIPGLKHSPSELAQKFGDARSDELIRLVGGSADFVFDLVQRHCIPCDARQSGWIQAIHHPRLAGPAYKRAEEWQSRGAPIEILDGKETAAALGTNAYFGGWLDRRAGCLNPLAYARGLASAASSAGAEIYEGSSVTSIRREASGYVVETADGRATARSVIMATNAYTQLPAWNIRKSIIPARSFQVATGKLGDADEYILPRGQVVSDTQNILLYFRRSECGRLVMGGIGSIQEPTRYSQFSHLYRAVQGLFPNLNPKYAYHWHGNVAITPDFLPHLHEPVPGVFCALGYNGRGVAMATVLGAILARRVLGESPEELPFPTTHVNAIPLYPIRNLYVASMRSYYRLKDAMSPVGGRV